MLRHINYKADLSQLSNLVASGLYKNGVVTIDNDWKFAFRHSNLNSKLDNEYFLS